MSVLEMAAGAVEEPRPVTDPSLDIRVLQRPTLVQPKVPKPLQENPAEANRLKTNSGLSIDSVTQLLDYNLNADYFNVNVSNQLSPVLEFKGSISLLGGKVKWLWNFFPA